MFFSRFRLGNCSSNLIVILVLENGNGKEIWYLVQLSLNRILFGSAPLDYPTLTQYCDHTNRIVLTFNTSFHIVRAIIAGPHSTQLPLLHKGRGFDLDSVENLSNASRLPLMVNTLDSGLRFFVTL